MSNHSRIDVWYDARDERNPGWAYDSETGSGGLDGHEEEHTLTRSEALAMAHQALHAVNARPGAKVRVYWHGEQDPIEWSAADLEDGTAS